MWPSVLATVEGLEVKGVKGRPGFDGLPGNDGLPGLSGFPGQKGI